ncbi:hypothetical protein M758_10G065000 [Ceratodon purpureus]|nr:hypothetical protein M758_10G065000 [Ceratodon purpureus]
MAGGSMEAGMEEPVKSEFGMDRVIFNVMSIGLILIVLLTLLLWIKKHLRERERQRILFEERRKMSRCSLFDVQCIQAISEGEAFAWFNEDLKVMWRVCVERFFESMAPLSLNKYKPKFVRNVTLLSLHLGGRSPEFSLIRVLPASQDGDDVVFEAAMEFVSDEKMNGQMVVQVKGVKSKFVLTGLCIKGTVKISVKGSPVLGRVRLTFEETPIVDMNARPTGADSFLKWLEVTVVAALKQSVVEPYMLVIDMEKLVSKRPQGLQDFLSIERKSDFVLVEILEAGELKAAEGAGLPDLSVEVRLGAVHRERTKKIMKTTNPIWENEMYRFPITNWDLPNLLTMSVISGSKLERQTTLGICSIPVKDYLDGSRHIVKLALMTPNVPTGWLRFAITVEHETITVSPKHTRDSSTEDAGLDAFDSTHGDTDSSVKRWKTSIGLGLRKRSRSKPVCKEVLPSEREMNLGEQAGNSSSLDATEFKTYPGTLGMRLQLSPDMTSRDASDVDIYCPLEPLKLENCDIQDLDLTQTSPRSTEKSSQLWSTSEKSSLWSTSEKSSLWSTSETEAGTKPQSQQIEVNDNSNSLSQIRAQGDEFVEAENREVVENRRSLQDHINDIPNDPMKSDCEFICTLKKRMEAMTSIQIVGFEEASSKANCCDQSTIVLGTFNATNDNLEFYFESGESMARLVGVGLSYAKVIVKRGIVFEVQEIETSDWKKVWLEVEEFSNNLFTIMQVSLPARGGFRGGQLEDGRHIAASSSSIKHGFPCNTLDASDDNFEVPYIWELAKFFIMKQAIDVANQNGCSDDAWNGTLGVNLKEDYPKFGNETVMTWVETLKVLFSKGATEANDNSGDSKRQEEDHRGGGDGGNGDGNGGDGDFSRENSKVDLKSEGEYFTSVNVFLLSGGDFFERNMEPLSHRLPLSIERLDNVRITPELTFGFCKIKKTKKIQVTTRAIFALDRDCDDIDTYGHFGWFHDEIHVSFGPMDRNIQRTVYLQHDFKDIESIPGKTTTTASLSKETTKVKGKDYQARLTVGSSQVARARVGANMIHQVSSTDNQSNEQSLESPINQTYGGFKVQAKPVMHEALLEYKYIAPYFEINADQIQDRRYRYELSSHPLCNLQKTEFVGTWVPIESNEVVEYIFKAERRLHEILIRREEEPPASTSSGLKIFRKPNRENPGVHVTSSLERPITQAYEKQLFVNHAMAHLINGQTYTLIESSTVQNPYQDLDAPLVTFPVLVDYQ